MRVLQMKYIKRTKRPLRCDAKDFHFVYRKKLGEAIGL